MEAERRLGSGSRALICLLMLGAATLAPIARAAGVRDAVRATQAFEEGSGSPSDEIERWWGVAGAVLCGIEGRLILRAPAIGMNPYALAAGIGGCILAFIDLKSTT